MNVRYTLSRNERLKSRSQIDLLFKEGKRGFVYPLRYVFLEHDPAAETPLFRTPGCGQTAVLVSVPKRNHKRAHVRNLLKRRMREAYRLNKPLLSEAYALREKGLSLGLLYASEEVLDYKIIENAVAKIIRKLAESR